MDNGSGIVPLSSPGGSTLQWDTGRDFTCVLPPIVVFFIVGAWISFVCVCVCYVLGNVYNITPYLEFHPGGVSELMRGAGMDCSELFDEVNWSIIAPSPQAATVQC